MKIDLGCGVNKPEGYIGIDNVTEADIQHDLCEGIPFEAGTVDVIRAKDILEHLPDTIFIMNECWRVLKPEGVLEIIVPRFPHVDSVKDPTHIKFFTVETFTEYFTGPDRLEEEYRMHLWNTVNLKFEDHRIWVTLKPRRR